MDNAIPKESFLDAIYDGRFNLILISFSYMLFYIILN